ncbi:SDR family oxidoreductase [Mucilaginibacter auburnensis]|uniref:Nucleoside-diphosphate-sugar epimerase n=1 Tax=Mucilaginibacter auburnensis TaxID=1457233 RepID=A0A2H9VW93_9SPHI|nr:SDR family oxidoreductase [Mucilaginibacter auburnensis]PJJ85084.1 nucleoside-diphosphate-sugar epimerase [Mucilaginibacter auburnensis]
MKVFVTGASGFVGSAIVEELLNNGHQVLGLVRNEKGAEMVASLGAETLLGDVNDSDIITKGAQTCDAVIHTAFNHDFTQYKASCEADRKVIGIFADALAGTSKPLVVTSGVGILHYNREVTEMDALTAGADVIPRAASEEAANEAAAKGTDVYVVRLPASVHDAGDHGFVPMVINMAREHGASAYVGDGSNVWPAVHRTDAAAVYRLIIEQKPDLKTLHPVGDKGIPFIEIAKAVAKGLNLPLVSKTGDGVTAHFGWLAHFAGISCLASSELTKQTLGWEPKGLGLLADVEANYF